MAWSDAARAAALEVRRAHSAAKRLRPGNVKLADLSEIYHTGRGGVPTDRLRLASALRKMRSGILPPSARTAGVATVSTRFRNAKRLGKAIYLSRRP
jgi:hypothetical protein